MIESPFFWLTLNAFTILMLAFYSMEEMAAVSFNRVRLQFYVSQGSKRAKWLNSLLQNPSTLFITTLIGVNVATFIGSESARKFHQAIGLSPDLAPLSQIILVIIFGELAPMFAARRYSEHVALMGVGLLYFSAKLLTPFIWLLSFTTKIANRLMGGHVSHPEITLTQEELKRVFEDQREDATTSNIITFGGKTAKDAMIPLNEKTVISSQETVEQVRKLKIFNQKYLVVYHESLNKIIGIVYIKDLLREHPQKKLKSFCTPPWFVSASTPLVQIIKQFRRSSENIAIALDDQGFAIGYLTFEDILDEIFGETGLKKAPKTDIVIDRELDGEISLKALQKELEIVMEGQPDETLSEWMIRNMEHSPAVGESVTAPPYQFTITEMSILEIKKVRVETL